MSNSSKLNQVRLYLTPTILAIPDDAEDHIYTLRNEDFCPGIGLAENFKGEMTLCRPYKPTREEMSDESLRDQFVYDQYQWDEKTGRYTEVDYDKIEDDEAWTRKQQEIMTTFDTLRTILKGEKKPFITGFKMIDYLDTFSGIEFEKGPISLTTMHRNFEKIRSSLKSETGVERVSRDRFDEDSIWGAWEKAENMRSDVERSNRAGQSINRFGIQSTRWGRVSCVI